MSSSSARKNIIVVGATSGIGLAVTTEFLKRGHRVLALGRSLDHLKPLQKQFNDTLSVLYYDIMTAKSTDVIVKAQQTMGAIDIVFLNSGVASEDNFESWSKASITMQTNVVGTTEFLHNIYNHFRGGGLAGTIAVNTSVAGMRGLRQEPIYSASKGFLVLLLQGLRGMSRHDFRKTGAQISLVDIRPGFVDTAMAGRQSFWKSPIGKAANQIVDGILCKKEILYVSKRWVLVAFVMRAVPRWIYERIT